VKKIAIWLPSGNGNPWAPVIRGLRAAGIEILDIPSGFAHRRRSAVAARTTVQKSDLILMGMGDLLQFDLQGAGYLIGMARGGQKECLVLVDRNIPKSALPPEVLQLQVAFVDFGRPNFIVAAIQQKLGAVAA
jgi:hypothetical protein